MPYVHCSRCDHEWETTDLKEKCDWCGHPIGRVLEKETPLERMLNNPIKILTNFLEKRKK